MITVSMGGLWDEALRWLYVFASRSWSDILVEAGLIALIAALATSGWRLRELNRQPPWPRLARGSTAEPSSRLRADSLEPTVEPALSRAAPLGGETP